MIGLILAAGKGTRLMPITKEIPKCLVEVKGDKMLDQWVRHMKDAGCKKIYINTHYMSEKVQQHLRNHPNGIDQIEILHEKNLLGTAGTIIENINKFDKEDLLVAHCDNYFTGDIRKFVGKHDNRKKDCWLTVMTFQSENPQTCGIFKLDNAGRIQRYWEKSNKAEGNTANGAVYLMDKRVIEWMGGIKEHCFEFTKDVLPLVLDHTQTVQCDGILMDIGTPENLKKANSL